MYRLALLLFAVTLVSAAGCRPSAEPPGGEGSGEDPAPGATTETDPQASGDATPGAPAAEAPGGDGAVTPGDDDGATAPGAADPPAVADPAAPAADDDAPAADARPPADLVRPLARMPAGATWAVAVDLGALADVTRGVPTLTDGGGLDAALGGALARAVGAPALADRVRAPGDGVLTVGAWGDDGDDVTWFAPATALATPPTDGGPAAVVADDVRAARRGGEVAVGRGYGVTAFAGGAAGGLDTAEIAGAAAALPVADATFVGWWAAPAVDAALPGIGATVDGVAVAVDPDGAVRVALATSDMDATLRAIGRGQAWTSMALGQWRRNAPADTSAAVALVARYVELSWSRVTVTPHEGHVVVRVAPPSCGGPLRNVPVAAALLGVVEAAAHDEAAPTLPFAPTSIDTVGCDTPQGPAPTIPRTLARLAPAESDPGLVVLADLGAIVRHVAPDAGGLLPAAIDLDVLDAAVGGRPFGLDGLSDTAGHIGVWIQAAPTSPERALVLPRGIADLDVVQQAGPGATIGDMVLNAVVPGGLLFATRGTPAATRLDGDGTHAWVDAAARLPDDTLAAVLIPASLVDPWLARLPQGDGAAVEAAMRDADVIAVAWTASRGPALVFGPGVDATAVRAALPSALTTGVGAIGRYGLMTPADRADLSERLGQLTRGMAIEADDTRTLLVFDGGGLSLVATTLTVALPAIGAAIENPGFDLPQVTPQLIYDATRSASP